MQSAFHFFLVLLTGIIAGGCLQNNDHLALGLLAQDRVVLTATSSELILEQPVREGSPVRTGDLLVQLDDSLQQALVAQAEAEVDIAAAQLEELKNGTRLRVLISERIGQPVEWLARRLPRANQNELQQVRPSLEDVFVSVYRYTEKLLNRPSLNWGKSINKLAYSDIPVV